MQTEAENFITEVYRAFSAMNQGTSSPDCWDEAKDFDEVMDRGFWCVVVCAVVVVVVVVVWVWMVVVLRRDVMWYLVMA